MDFEKLNSKINLNEEIEEIRELIKKLPKELRNRWIEKLDNGENPSEIKEIVKEIIAERNEIKKESFSGLEEEKIFNDGLDNEERIVFNETIKKIAEEALENKKNNLGEGRSARVITSQIDSMACFKIIYNIEEYKKGNTVKREAELLQKAIKANKTKVKLPSPYYYKMDKNVHLYVMEKLEAVTIKEVLNKERKLPENFNSEIFFKELEEFLKNIHEDGIYHRDLLEGNIMIDEKTGMPCVIDFGCSASDYSGNIEEIYRKYNETTREKDNFAVDENAILENKKKLNIFLKERGSL